MADRRILQRLCSIRDAYARIRSISEHMDERLDADALSEALACRAQLLNQVADEQSHIEQDAENWRTLCRSAGAGMEILQQIRAHIYAITDRDVVLQQIARDRIATIKNELFGLPERSRAVRAYMGHKDALVPRGARA